MEVKRLFDIPYYQLYTNELADALVTKEQGNWIKTSTKEYIEKAGDLSRGLLKLGIKPGEKIAIISHNNQTDWNICDIGIQQAGMINVPIYPTLSADDIAYILNDAQVAVCFVSNEELYEKVNKAKQNVPSLKNIYSFKGISNAHPSLDDLLALGKDHTLQGELEGIKNNIHEDDLATIIYTSGTTGKPKGVMLSHKNILSDIMGSIDRVPRENISKALSFLPVCHIFERMLTYLYQYNGISIYYAESIETISDNLKEIKPELMSAVPRLLEKVYDKIVLKGSELTGIKKGLFFWALNLGHQYKPFEEMGWWYDVKLSIARKLIFSKWKEALGGNLKVIISGSAPLQPRLAKVFTAAGIPVMEGYGLTETAPVISVNALNKDMYKVGSVGKPLSNVVVKIAADGEILVKGPNVTKGYFNNPEKTAEEFTADGFFKTGDIGILDEGFLRITDRKKEMFKTSGGKYVAPQPIENLMKQSRFIEQIMVVGEGQKMPCAFVQPDFAFVKDWATHKGITLSENPKEVIKSQELIDRIQEEITQKNETLGKWEQIKKFVLTPEVWSVDNGLLTPTMKLKRKIVMEKYKDLYKELYPEGGEL